MSNSPRSARPDARADREKHHGAIAGEERGSDGSLYPRETGAVGAAQLGVMDGDEHHERGQQKRPEPCAPAPESRDEKQDTREGFERTESDGRENAQ